MEEDQAISTASSNPPPFPQQRPLIDQATNRWQEDIKFSYDTSNEADTPLSRPGLNRGILASRRFRRMLLVLVLLLSLVFWAWRWHLRPRWLQEWEYQRGFLSGETSNGTFGIAKAGHFDGTRVRDLDPRLLPGGSHDPHGKRRLIFVGDIHGCADELQALLKKVDFDTSSDHLIAVGDVVSKGPKNPQVLDLLIHLHADSVRGNHEDRILAIDSSSTSAPSTAETSSKGAAKDHALLRQLNPTQISYLHNMPLMLRIPSLPQARKSTHKLHSPIAEDILVVHAGLVPAVPLSKQDPYFVMNMRAIHKRTHLPLADAADDDESGRSMPWHRLWEWYNARIFARKSLKGFRRVWREEENDAKSVEGKAVVPPTTSTTWGEWTGWLTSSADAWWHSRPKAQVVVYGHHSKEGLQMSRWSKGLDTACVRGGRLTALVLDARGKYEVVSVRCEDYRD